MTTKSELVHTLMKLGENSSEFMIASSTEKTCQPIRQAVENAGWKFAQVILGQWVTAVLN